MASPTNMYDFVIIGGGTAGLVVAARLSEDPRTSVLVLEAGRDLTEDPRTRIPIFHAALLGSEADWAFRTEPQAGLNGRSIVLNQGKALGGSGAINAQVFVPPGESPIDAWETLGNGGWNWADFRRYLARSYAAPPVDRGTEKALGIASWRSQDDAARGPLRTSFSGDVNHPVRAAWAEAFAASGRPCMADDPFLGGSVGAFTCLASIDPATKERTYSASAYYNPVKDSRANLHVLTGAQVDKILFESQGDDAAAAAAVFTKATCVRYTHDGETKTVNARKEIILAAGALQSPKILELSGVGDAELLARRGVDVVVADLPGVGENLQDHLVCFMNLAAAEGVATLDALVRQEPEAVGRAMHEYETGRTGPLTTLGVHTCAYLPLPADARAAVGALLDQTRPDDSPGPRQARARAYHDVAARALLDPAQPSAAYLSALAQTNYPTDVGVAPSPSPGNFITIALMLSHPLSRGSTHICHGGDAAAPPVINPGYLSNPVDVEVVARHLLEVKRIVDAASLRALLAEPLTHRHPDADFGGTNDDGLEAAREYARSNLVSMWHLAGTCAMLPREKGGVLDPQLRVHGIENLRVVDASAIPLISTANIQATVYAVAEKAADLIKETWGA